MNIYESQKLEEELLRLSLSKVDDLAKTDIFIINSCSVRQAAEDSVYGLGKELKKLARKPMVILTGCVTGAAKSARRRYEVAYLQKKAPFVDYFLTSEEIVANITDIVGATRGSSVIAGGSRPAPTDGLGYVPISYGCNNFCSYCIVPYARGPERSRPFSEIKKEVEDLIAKGITEIMLLGQNVNSWDGNVLDVGVQFIEPETAGSINQAPTIRRESVASEASVPRRFSDLLKSIHELRGLTKLSFMTSNPWDFGDDLVEALKLPKIDRYLHLPVQSGDDGVLRRMNRHYTRQDYLTLVAKIKTAVPEIRIGTDIIVGFPGETDEEFKNTLDLIKQVGFKPIFVSMYSLRKGTVAAETRLDDVPKSVKRQRHQQVLNLCRTTS